MIRNIQRPTSEQQRAIDKALRLKTSFKLIAFAGTGKTTTLIHCSTALQQHKKKWIISGI